MDKLSFGSITVDLVGSSQKSYPNDCCVYLVSDRKKSILIDTGAGSKKSIEKIKRNISKILPLDRVEYILVTHAHIDHVGGLKEIKSCLPRAKIIAHPYAAEVIFNEDPILSAANWYNMHLKSVPIDIISHNLKILIKGGFFQVIASPGHTPGSVVGLLSIEKNNKKIIFGQDIHGPFYPSWKSDIVQWKQSMEKILSWSPDYLAEGHFGIIKGKEKVKEFIMKYINEFC